jgi:hypothetical protein
VAVFESVLTAIEAVKDILTAWHSAFLAASVRGHRVHLSMSGDITIMKADLAKPVTAGTKLNESLRLREKEASVSAFPPQ